jgi:hypothetical protein
MDTVFLKENFPISKKQNIRAVAEKSMPPPDGN